MLMQVVDGNDEYIGDKERSELDFQKDIYRVAALWLTNSANEVLIAQRKFSKDRDPGLWGPAVAGTVEPGETYETNIYKEAEEEIGLSGLVFTLGPKLRVKTPRNYFCQWYKDKLVQEVAQQPEKYIPTMAEVLSILGIA
jgi:isopentenyldiphosphate isomerase